MYWREMTTTGLVQILLLVSVQLSLFCPSASGDKIYYSQQMTGLEALASNWTNGQSPPGYLPGWGSKARYTGVTTPCFAAEFGGENWQGVECLQLPQNSSYVGNITNNTGNSIITVVGLTLRDASISGNLPEAIGYLAPLLFLTLTGNPNLRGPIPQKLLDLSNSLITLDLHDNGFTGPMPSAISYLPRLHTLDLSNNSLTGRILYFSNSSELQTLDLSRNELSGDIEGSAFSRCTSLITLDLSNNNFFGKIPRLNPYPILPYYNSSSTIGLSMAKYINLSRNAFSESLYNVSVGAFFQSYNYWAATDYRSALRVLDLSYNNISGNVSDLEALMNRIGPEVQEVYLNDNNISGTLFFNSLYNLGNHGNFSSLQILSLANNSIEKVEGFTASTILGGDRGLFSNIRLEGNPFCNTKADYNSNEGFAIRCLCQNDCLNYALAKKARSDGVKIALAISVPIVVVVVLVAALLYRKSTEQVRQHKYNLIQMQKRFEEYDVKPTIFTYKELEIATQNFHPSMKLGEGSYGAVYKGELSKSNIVDVGELSKSNIVAVKTVKQLQVGSEQGMDEFLNEVALISGMKHRNLVKLKGCCLREKQRLLVYEYVDNHDLEWHLLQGKSKEILSWSQRLRICMGVAHGLHYLHSLAQPKIIHRDIKAANILLDNNFEPKIADFGLALLFPEEMTHIMTIHVAGTKGYLAPEYASLGQLSEKVDVYSFGVVCLEVVAGRRIVDNTMELPEQVVLTNWALKLYREGRVVDILDSKLDTLSENELVEVNRVIVTALLCLQHNEAQRPQMVDVVAMLHGELHTHVDIEAADTPLGFDEYNSTSFKIQQLGLTTIMEDRSIRLFEGQNNMERSLYQRQCSKPHGID